MGGWGGWFTNRPKNPQITPKIAFFGPNFRTDTVGWNRKKHTRIGNGKSKIVVCWRSGRWKCTTMQQQLNCGSAVMHWIRALGTVHCWIRAAIATDSKILPNGLLRKWKVATAAKECMISLEYCQGSCAISLNFKSRIDATCVAKNCNKLAAGQKLLLWNFPLTQILNQINILQTHWLETLTCNVSFIGLQLQRKCKWESNVWDEW